MFDHDAEMERVAEASSPAEVEAFLDTMAEAVEREQTDVPATFDGDRPASENEEPETVMPGAECPDCHEARMDYLVWDEEGETVTCTTCGCVYVP